MNTKFKLIFKNDKSDVDITKFGESLPLYFDVIEEGDEIYITIESKNGESEECQYLINRELDRHFFLTSVRVHAEMVRSIVTASLKVSWDIQNHLPENIAPQSWNYDLPIQLKLWSVAIGAEDISLKVILFYQIIELAYPDQNFPKYNGSSIELDPLTECKFLRDLAAHAGEVDKKQLQRYCEYLKTPGLMIDRTDPDNVSILSRKLDLLQAQAKKIISKSITYEAM